MVRQFRLTHPTLIAAIFLAACSSVPPAAPSGNHQWAEVQLQQAMDHPDRGAHRQLRSALEFFEETDNQSLQWQANYGLANWHMMHDEVQEAFPYAMEAHRLAEQLGQLSPLYWSAFQMGQLSQETFYYESALNLAQSDLDRALALAALNRSEEAARLFKPLNPRQSPKHFAYLYYQYGKQLKDIDAVLTALSLYRQAGFTNGVVDSLFLASQLSEDPRMARTFAERALKASQHLDSTERLDYIRQWLSAQDAAHGR